MKKRREPVLGAEIGAQQERDAEGKRGTRSLGRAADDLSRLWGGDLQGWQGDV